MNALTIIGFSLAFLDFSGLSRYAEHRIDELILVLRKLLAKQSLETTRNNLQKLKRASDFNNISYVGCFIMPLLLLCALIFLGVGTLILQGLELEWYLGLVGAVILLYLNSIVVQGTYWTMQAVITVVLILSYACALTFAYFVYFVLRILNKPKVGFVGSVSFLIAVLSLARDIGLWNTKTIEDNGLCRGAVQTMPHLAVISMESSYYLNTDLEILSTHDLSELKVIFEDKCNVLHGEKVDDEKWLLCVEARESGMPEERRLNPEKDMSSLLEIIENLNMHHQDILRASIRYEFSIGWQTGKVLPATTFTISNAILRRVALLGASITTTIYPPEDGDE